MAWSHLTAAPFIPAVNRRGFSRFVVNVRLYPRMHEALRKQASQERIGLGRVPAIVEQGLLGNGKEVSQSLARGEWPRQPFRDPIEMGEGLGIQHRVASSQYVLIPPQ